jgi:hypothetical protein
MNLQDRYSSTQLKSMQGARERIKLSENRNVMAIFESGKIVKLKSQDSMGINLNVLSGSDVFNGKTEITFYDLLEKPATDFTLGSLRIPGRGHVAQNLSGAMHIMSLKSDVSPLEALHIANETPGIQGFSRAGVAMAIDTYRVKPAEPVIDEKPEDQRASLTLR